MQHLDAIPPRIEEEEPVSIPVAKKKKPGGRSRRRRFILWLLFGSSVWFMTIVLYIIILNAFFFPEQGTWLKVDEIQQIMDASIRMAFLSLGGLICYILISCAKTIAWDFNLDPGD